MKAGGLRLSGQLEIPEGHPQPSPSQLLSVLCTALMLSSFSGSQLPSLLSNRAPHSVFITMSRTGLKNFFFPLSGNLERCQNAELPLSVECGAQLFVCSLARPGAIAALIFSSGTGRISRRRRLGYQSSRDTNHSHRGAYRRGVRVCMCV